MVAFYCLHNKDLSKKVVILYPMKRLGAFLLLLLIGMLWSVNLILSLPIILFYWLKWILVPPKHLFQQEPKEFRIIHEIALIHPSRLLQKAVEPLHVQLSPYHRRTLDVSCLKVDGSSEGHPDIHPRHLCLVRIYPFLLLRTANTNEYDSCPPTH